MRVLLISPRGYCHGVVAAVSAVERCLSDPTTPRPIHILGMIVHNRFVVDRFTSRGVITLDGEGLSREALLDRVRTGTVVVTAHGVGNDVYEAIRAKGLHLVDATCGDVRRTHAAIDARIEAGDAVVYIGKAGHPETEGVLSRPGVILIENVHDAMTVVLPDRPLFVTNQTTFSIRDIIPIIEAIRRRRPDADVGEEICDATRKRQEAVARDAVQADLLLVVGDPRSNNTANLVRIGRDVARVRTERIASAAEIDPSWLDGVDTVAVTSGASTPTDVTAEVVAFLEDFRTVRPGD
jgi:4-hydroxy-3-methylbut-2-enyl diphosphate reductase